MRITEALKTIQQTRQEAPRFSAVLACSFTPLHLQTFFAAWLQRKLPERNVAVTTGLYGDLIGTLSAARAVDHHAVAVPLEWSDLDPRLSFRSAGKWGQDAVSEILENARLTLARVAVELERLSASLPIAVSLPTTGLPPMFHTPGWQYSEAELLLERELLEFAARLARIGCGVVNSSRLAENSSHHLRYDLKSDLLTGLPYTLSHASALGEALATLLAPPPPKKGLITDLDDTLWHGLVGEVGADQVSWDLASHQHAHGLYQKLLCALASEGILIAAASKNDPAIVRQALERKDLLLSPETVFPVEVHWEPKSGSVGRILRTWNIGAESVVFVDDSPMELAEVAAAHPGIEPILFPKDDPNQVYSMLRRLRDLLGKPRISAEDSIRLESIRQTAIANEERSNDNDSEDFLRRAGAVIQFDHQLTSRDSRALELINKTNQFNLNGVRLAPADWVARLSEPGAVLMAVSYQDKFGPLGKIAVLQGHSEGEALRIQTWVMSCRAFSRRIEHQCLRTLFDHYGVERVVFDFKPTPKNGPVKEFLAHITGAEPEGIVTLERAQFDRACPSLYHRTEQIASSRSWTRLQTA